MTVQTTTKAETVAVPKVQDNAPAYFDPINVFFMCVSLLIGVGFLIVHARRMKQYCNYWEEADGDGNDYDSRQD